MVERLCCWPCGEGVLCLLMTDYIQFALFAGEMAWRCPQEPDSHLALCLAPQNRPQPGLTHGVLRHVADSLAAQQGL